MLEKVNIFVLCLTKNSVLPAYSEVI